MNCFTHGGTPAVGICAVCQKAVCHQCVAQDTPRLVCRSCAARGPIAGFGYGYGLGYGFEYRSALTIGSWPLVHIASGVDPVTMRLRVAKGIIAIGNVAVGVIAVGGVAGGLAAFGGLSVGLILALGGAALGAGLSIGGLAVGSVAIGGAAVGAMYAIGGAAFGPAVIDARRCDELAREFFIRWTSTVPRCP